MALAVYAILALAGEVRRQIDAVATANSDSTQWTLAQADVELLVLQNAIAHARADPTAPLDEVRTRFDIFYSRAGTLAGSPLFDSLRDDPYVIAALGRIKAYLSAAVPVIDGDDEILRSALAELARRTEAIRPDVRTVSLRGVNVLSAEADIQRLRIADTLSMVSFLTIALFLVLILMLGLLLLYVRRARQRALEQGLMRSRLAAIVSTSLDAVVVVDRDGKVIDFNGAAERIFGYARDEALGRLMEDLIVPEHLADAHREGMSRYRTTGEKRVIGKGRVQLEARRKSGEIFPVELSISTADSQEGEIFVSFLRDISRRVASERAKADFIAVMSHEMRTPLNGMLGTLELLDPALQAPKAREYLDIIRASGKLLLHHVDNVLEISRAEAGKIDIASEVFSLSALIRELVDSQRGVAEHRGNALSQRVDAHGADLVEGDPTRLRQVLLNLIGNAVKFTRNGAITVEAERLGEAELVEIRVSDTGIGIAPDDHERIFEDFVTLDASYARAVGGTGLGLAIVRRLVGSMGGEVGLESADGKGSVFRVRLPLPCRTDAPQVASGAPQSQHRDIAPLRVLVVEDNSINRIVTRDLLEEDGHHVDEAMDGKEGADRARRSSYDLVLMDISMPVMDGVEATREIRRMAPAGVRLPIVALTAHAIAADQERFRAAGLDDILIKPISRASLRDILARHCGAGVTLRQDSAAPQPPAATLDRAHFEDLACALGPEKTDRLIVDFTAEMDAAIARIVTSITDGTANEALRGRVHHATGSAALLGAEALRRALADLEDRIAAGGALNDTAGPNLEAIWAETAAELSAQRLSN